MSKIHLTILVCGIVDDHVDSENFSQLMAKIKSTLEDHLPGFHPDQPPVTIVTNKLPDPEEVNNA